MKVLKIIGIIIIVIFAIGFIAILTLPNEAHMSRSVVIDASPQTIYRELITYKNFNSWSPWASKDTATVYTYEGPAIGVGAKMSWSSENDQVGSGSMEIIETKENELVKAKMLFEGFDSNPTASYIIEPIENGTKVTWTYDEEGITGVAKVFGAMMDKFLGPDYEAGLAGLKERIENAPKSDTEISVVKAPSFQYVGLALTSTPEMISTKMAQAYGQLMETVNKNNGEMSGAPLAVITRYTPEEMDFICGIPVASAFESSNEDEVITLMTMPAALSVKCTFLGDYAGTEAAHKSIEEYLAYANYEIAGNPWEEYITDPMMETDTSKWVTNIYYPIQ